MAEKAKLAKKESLKRKFTKKELLKELSELLEQIAENVSSFIGEEAGYAVLGLSPSHDGLSMEYPPLKVDPAILAKLPITDAMLRAYDYVMNARWPTGNDISEPLEDVALFMEFWRHLKSRESHCRYIHDAAFARWAIDEPWEEMNLDFEQIALLADVDERTVRNAASGKGPNQLITFKEGGRTCVRPEDALAWLKTRPSFRQTVFYMPTDHSFSNILEFGQFLSKTREGLGLEPEQFLHKIGWQNERLEELLGIEQGFVKCRLEDVISLAQGLDEQEEWFLSRFMEVFYPIEWRVITMRKDRN